MNWPGIRILLTGFGPFPGVPFNASSTLVAHLADTSARLIPRPSILSATLPTDWREAAVQSRRLIETFDPDVILHFGVSRRCTGFEIETQARNQASVFLDCAGRAPDGRKIRRGAPPKLKTTLPAPVLAQRLRLAGLPAMVSSDAGRYICNAVLYETLLRIRDRKPATLVGFIHIPALPSLNGNGAHGEAARAWRGLKTGAEIILRSTIPLAIALRSRSGRARLTNGKRASTIAR
jgi:pyroglutamyl-peptidase